MTDRELLELIAAQVGKLTVDVDEIKATLPTMATKDELAEIRSTIATKDDLAEIRSTMATKDNLAEVKNDLKFVKETVIRIENDHGQKLGALFDGYKLNSEKLDRIEKEVAKHEEFILKRIK